MKNQVKTNIMTINLIDNMTIEIKIKICNLRTGKELGPYL